MKKKTIFFPGCAVLLLCIVFSCQQDLNDVLLEENVAALTSKSTEDGDIDGGTLPEVVVTASYPLTFQFAPGPNTSFISDPQPWWHELPPIDYSGPGGGNGGFHPIKTQPDSVKVVENLVKFFPKGTNFTKQQLEKLNIEYKKLMSNCIYKTIDDYISENGKFTGGINMRKEDDSVGDASLDEEGNLNIYGERNITDTNLAHEWIHLCQRAFKPERAKSDPEYVGLMEFELALFQDMMGYAKNGENWAKRNDDVPPTQSWISSIPFNLQRPVGDIYSRWLESMFRNGFPTRIDLTSFMCYASLFGTHHLVYNKFGYNYYNKNYGVESINNLLQLISQNKCFENQ